MTLIQPQNLKDREIIGAALSRIHARHCRQKAAPQSKQALLSASPPPQNFCRSNR